TIATARGEALRRWRGGTRRQEDVAAIARQQGLNWRRSTVAAVEAGSRPMSDDEVLLLSQALRWRPEEWFTTGDSEDEADELALSTGARITRGALIQWLVSERGDPYPPTYWDRYGNEWSTPSTEVTRRMNVRADELLAEAR